MVVDDQDSRTAHRPIVAGRRGRRHCAGTWYVEPECQCWRGRRDGALQKTLLATGPIWRDQRGRSTTCLRRTRRMPDCSLAIASPCPAAANSAERFSFDDVIDEEVQLRRPRTTQVARRRNCILGHGRNMALAAIRFRYDGLFADPATGTHRRQVARPEHSNRRPDAIALERSGHLHPRPGQGVVYLRHRPPRLRPA